MEIIGFEVSEWIIAILLLLILFYIYSTWTFSTFDNMGIKGPKPLPLLGNLMNIFQEGFYYFDIAQQKKYGKIYRYFEGRVPHLSIGDVNILKHILVKDFSNFVNRREFHMRGILREGLFDSRDQKWKDSRAILSPTFSSGKLKMLIPAIQDCTNTLINKLEMIAESGEAFEAKNLCSQFTMDVLALTEFGMKLDLLNDPDNVLFQRAKEIFAISATNPLVLMVFLFPDLCKFLESFKPMSVIPSSTESYFNDLMTALLEERKRTNSRHVDLVKLMMDAEATNENTGAKDGKTKTKSLSREQIIDNAVLLILAGYETTATTLSFILYHLAVNEAVQDRLREEALEILEDKSDITHDMINSMQYCEMCINETLRLHPPVTRVDRMAQNTVVYEGLTIPKGMTVDIPILALHLDPEIWPDPEKFDPERFTPEAKAERNPYSYLPFGLGPRQCIGLRLAMMEIKAAMTMLVKHFRFVPCDKTDTPLNMKKEAFLPQAEKGIWVKVETLM